MDYVLIRLEVLLEDTFAVLAQKKPWHLQAVRNIVPTVGISQGQNPSRKSNQDCLQTVQQQVSTTPSLMPVSSAVGMKASAAKSDRPTSCNRQTGDGVFTISGDLKFFATIIFSSSTKASSSTKTSPTKALTTTTSSPSKSPVPKPHRHPLPPYQPRKFLTTSNQRQHSA
jgi:hypothetical protein